MVKVDRRIRWHYTTTILCLRFGAQLTRYRNCKFHNFTRTISRHADGISRYSVRLVPAHFYPCVLHTHPFNGPLSGTTWVSRYQKGKSNLDFTEARDSEWQWHQLGDMQVCISLQTDNHTSTSLLKFFTGRMPFLPSNQQCQSTEGTPSHWQMQKKYVIFSAWSVAVIILL